MELKYFICRHCGNLVALLEDHGVPLYCCGERMAPLTPNTTDAAGEKHVPVYSVQGDRVEVSVGSVEHPMTQDHSIRWVALHTDRGVHRRWLEPDQPPKATFFLSPGERLEGVYAYCNLHGLWKG